MKNEFEKFCFSENVFKANDLRGKFPLEINGEFAFIFGLFLGNYFAKKTIGKKSLIFAVGKDDSLISEILSENFIKGLNRSGASVLNFGLCSGPQLVFSLKKSSAHFGVMITASHLDKSFGGFKIFDFSPQAISGFYFLKPFKKFVEKSKSKNPNLLKTESVEKIGKTKNLDFSEEFADFLFEISGWEKNKKSGGKFRILFGGPKSVIRIIKKIKRKHSLFDFVFVERDYNSKNSGFWKREIEKKSADFGISFDADADRAFFWDKKIGKLETDYIAALLARYFGCFFAKQKFCVDNRMSSIVEGETRKQSGRIVLARSGHLYFRLAMERSNAIFGSEKSGHFYFRDFFHSDCGILAALFFIQALELFNFSSLYDLKNDFSNIFILPEKNFNLRFSKRAVLETKKYFFKKRGAMSEKNGLSFKFKDWRFVLSESQTESVLRLNMEANSRRMLDEKFAQIKKILLKFR